MVTALAVALTLSSCGFGQVGSGREATERREVSSFDSIVVAGQADVTVTPGDRSVTVRGDDNLLARVRTEVDGGTLVIDEDRPVTPRSGLVVEITTTALTGLTSQGSGDVAARDVAADTFTGVVDGSGNLDVTSVEGTTVAGTIDGSGDLTLDGVDTNTFTATLNGSGDLRATGRAQQIDLSVNGSGGAQLKGLAARQATVDLTGSGDAHVQVSEALTGSTSGSGDLVYAGDPPNVRADASGSGEVRPQ